MNELTDKFVKTNGIRMHLVEAGEGFRWSFATAFPSCGTRGAIRFARSPTPAFV